MRRVLYPFAAVFVISGVVHSQTAPEPKATKPIPYLHLTAPRPVLPDAQAWEGNEFPHSMSGLELKRDGFRYWGWYGLKEGRGIGLARSNDLVHWTKYEKNPLWTNARWPSVLAKASPEQKDILYFAITRDYDTPSSHIVLATSRDGIHLAEEKILVPGVTNQRNQNPNLFRDPCSGRFYLTFYRGNDRDHFEIISKSANSVTDLDQAPEKALIKFDTRVAAPTLLYLKNARNGPRHRHHALRGSLRQDVLVAARANREESETKTHRRKRTCQSIVTFAPSPAARTTMPDTQRMAAGFARRIARIHARGEARARQRNHQGRGRYRSVLGRAAEYQRADWPRLGAGRACPILPNTMRLASTTRQQSSCSIQTQSPNTFNRREPRHR